MAENSGIVVVTGSSRGLGRHMALHLASHGFDILAGVRRAEDGTRLHDEGGDAIRPMLLDVTDPQSIAAAVSTVRERAGDRGLAGLVNNAGLFAVTPLEQQRMEDIEQIFRVNVFGLMAVTQAMVPMLRASRGRIVNISSINGWLSPPYFGAYSASKFALEALSDALRVELRPFGVHVAVVQPDAVATDIRLRGVEDWARARGGLGEAEKALYANAFETMHAFIHGAQSGAGPVEEISDAVLCALTEPEPKTRYATDAMTAQKSQLLALSDLDRDIALLQMLGFQS